MNKKLVCMSILAGLLILNTSSIVLAAPVSTNTVVTGRTEQNRQTGVIMPTAFQGQVYHNVTKEITLMGTIIIDGPQLVFTVTDKDGNAILNSNITVTKVADKTYSYSVKVNPSAFKGNVDYILSAKTIYQNGKTAGQIHTTAPNQKQSIHVAYVKGFEYSNFTWGTYDRSQNQYSYSYDLAKVWDDETRDSKKVTGTVSGEDLVSIQGEDPTYDGGSVNLENKIPPVNIKSFETTTVADSDWIWLDNKYSANFTLIKNLSNGQFEEEQESISINPSTTYTYIAKDDRSPDYSQEFKFTAPAAPTPTVITPVVSDVNVKITDSRWTGNQANGGNVQEKYTLSYKINGQLFKVDLSNNFTKNGTGLFGNQNLNYEAYFDGKTVIINYTLPFIEPTSKDDNTSNN